jgi:hypothetical protein
MIRVDVAKWGQTTEDLSLASVHAAHPRSRERFQALYLIASGRFKEQGHALRARGGSPGRDYRMPVKARFLGVPAPNSRARRCRRRRWAHDKCEHQTRQEPSDGILDDLGQREVGRKPIPVPIRHECHD